MNTKPPKCKISSKASGFSKIWDIPAKKGIGFLMIFGCFFGGIPLLIVTALIYAAIFGSSSDSSNSGWALLGTCLFLSIFIFLGCLTFYFGLKMRYTSYRVTIKDGAVVVLKKLFKKSSAEELNRGNVYGVGLYSNSETNNKPNYGLVVKAREGKDIRFSNEHREDDLRWLASEMLVELSKQDALPTTQELEEKFFNSTEKSANDSYHFTKQGVTISLLNKEETNQFIIDKNNSTLAKSMLLGGLFGVGFSFIFIWIGFGAANADFIFGLAGIAMALGSFIAFILGILKLGTSEKYTFKSDIIIKEKLRKGLSKSKTTFKKSNYNKLTATSSGSSNNSVRYSIKLIAKAGGKPLTLFKWADGEVSEVVKLKVNQWLSPQTGITPQTELNSGYGSAITIESSQQKPAPQTILPSEVPIYNSEVNLKDIKGGIWYLRIFLALFITVGLSLSTFGFFNIKTAKDSETWPSQQGTILTSEISTSHNDDGTTYGADITYDFKIKGKVYTGDKVTISEISSSNYQRAQKIVAKYPVGKKIAVYYDPQSPESNVLETGLSGGSYLIPGIGLLFFIVPLIILIITERSRKNKSS